MLISTDVITSPAAGRNVATSVPPFGSCISFTPLATWNAVALSGGRKSAAAMRWLRSAVMGGGRTEAGDHAATGQRRTGYFLEVPSL